MNTNSESTPGPSAVRSCGAGVLAVTVLTGAALAVGLPEGTATYAVGGALLACVAGSLGCLVHLRGQSGARQFQMALAMDFLIKLVGLMVGAGVLWVAGVKFPGLAAFGLAYAGGSMVFQVVSSVSLARAWTRRNQGSPRSPTTGGSSRSDSLRRLPTTD